MDDASIRPYLQLRDRVDRFFSSVAARFADQVRCASGCSECCVAGLTVTMVEAVVMGAELGLPAVQVHLQAGQAPLRATGYCAMLDGEGRCRVYAARPLVCRSHGLPLWAESGEGYDVCPLNFRSVAPHPTAILNTENLHAALFAANVVYCRAAGVDMRSRVAVDRIAQLVGWIPGP